MSATLAIAKREFRGYFASPLGFIILILFSIVLGVFVYEWTPFGVPTLFAQSRADLSSMFHHHHLPLMFVLFGSAISMRLWSEERRLGTEELLLTFPVRPIEAVLGKFLGALGMLFLCLVTTLPTVVIVGMLTDDDRGLEFGPIFGGYLAALILGGACVAVGQLFSAFTRDQLVAFLISFVLLLLWFLLDSVADADFLPKSLAGLMKQVSLASLFDKVARGQLVFRNIVLLLSVCVGALGINSLVLTLRKA